MSSQEPPLSWPQPRKFQLMPACGCWLTLSFLIAMATAMRGTQAWRQFPTVPFEDAVEDLSGDSIGLGEEVWMEIELVEFVGDRPGDGSRALEGPRKG